MYQVGLQTANTLTKKKKTLMSSARQHLFICTAVQHLPMYVIIELHFFIL